MASWHYNDSFSRLIEERLKGFVNLWKISTYNIVTYIIILTLTLATHCTEREIGQKLHDLPKGTELELRSKSRSGLYCSKVLPFSLFLAISLYFQKLKSEWKSFLQDSNILLKASFYQHYRQYWRSIRKTSNAGDRTSKFTWNDNIQ